MRVAGLGYRGGVRNVEVILESLSGGRRRRYRKTGRGGEGRGGALDMGSAPRDKLWIRPWADCIERFAEIYDKDDHKWVTRQ